MSKISTSRKILYASAGLTAGALVAALVIKPPAFLRFSSPVELGETNKPGRFWCSKDPLLGDGTVVAYVEKTMRTKGSELGVAGVVDASRVFDGSKQLAFTCAEDGTVWWVTEKFVYVGRLASSDECCTLNIEQKIPHAQVPEYHMPGVSVLAASIWLPVGESTPVVATITNTGWFQAFKLPKGNLSIDEKFIYRLWGSPSLSEQELRPQNVTGASIGVLNTREFSVVPFGDSHTYFYFRWPGGQYRELVQPDVWIMDIRDVERDFNHITGASPIGYDEERDRTGWTVTISGVNNVGSQVILPRVVKPQQLLQQNDSE
ncbi:MAG: hypothetical protein ABID61_04420 [Candidatus Micrarchaeota archaeon]